MIQAGKSETSGMGTLDKISRHQKKGKSDILVGVLKQLFMLHHSVKLDYC